MKAIRVGALPVFPWLVAGAGLIGGASACIVAIGGHWSFFGMYCAIVLGTVAPAILVRSRLGRDCVTLILGASLLLVFGSQVMKLYYVGLSSLTLTPIQGELGTNTQGYLIEIRQAEWYAKIKGVAYAYLAYGHYRIMEMGIIFASGCVLCSIGASRLWQAVSRASNGNGEMDKLD